MCRSCLKEEMQFPDAHQAFRFKPSAIGSPARDTYLLPLHRFKGCLFFLLAKRQLQYCSGPTSYVVCLCHINPRVQIMSSMLRPAASSRALW